MIEAIVINYDLWFAKGKLSNESFLREWRDYVDWDIVFKYNVKFSNDFLLELYKQQRLNIYQMSINHLLNKDIIQFLKRDIDRYDDKYQVEYNYKYFPPIWEIIFTDVKNKNFKNKMFERYIRFKSYKWVRKSELKHIPKEVAGIWDC